MRQSTHYYIQTRSPLHYQTYARIALQNLASEVKTTSTSIRNLEAATEARTDMQSAETTVNFWACSHDHFTDNVQHTSRICVHITHKVYKLMLILAPVQALSTTGRFMNCMDLKCQFIKWSATISLYSTNCLVMLITSLNCTLLSAYIKLYVLVRRNKQISVRNKNVYEVSKCIRLDDLTLLNI